MQETVTMLSSFISSVGFPIVACCMMYWQNNKLSETLNKNTEALIELKTIIKEDKNYEN